MRRNELVVNDVRPGQTVVAIASFGKANYETSYNSGIGSNGLTSARHDVLHRDYARLFPDSYDPNTPESVVYCGPHHLGDAFEGHSVADLLLSPTRTYLPLLKSLIPLIRPSLHGLIHCSGGGQTKVLKFIDACRIVKDNLFEMPPVFRMIRASAGTPLREMYQVFNMGHRLELYLDDNAVDLTLAMAREMGLEARMIGRVEAAAQAEVLVRDREGEYLYTA
jgi:phosphoribosylformylglycinamidine cyclo-ligase